MGVRGRGGRQLRVVVVVGVVLASMSVGATAQAQPNRELTTMTQNLYLGSSLQPAIDATTPAQFVAAVATIYATMLFTDFPKRAQVIADEIAAEQPDLIGLQEVSKWTATPTHPGPTPPSVDFLAILQADLAARGLSYDVASVSQNADIGPAPLVAPAFGCNPFTTAPDCVVTLSDRDVILVNRHTPALHWRGPATGRYAAQATLDVPGAGAVSFDRGWTSIEVKYRGRSFRFVDTHLEVEQFAATQEAQAGELLAVALAGATNAVVVGDFNSAADGSTTDTYDIVTSQLTDAWTSADPGVTCCQNATLTNPTSQLSTRVDLVLTRGTVTSSNPRRLVGGPLSPPAPLWASDHASVLADVQLH
jgi:endonuclease/exonuclease/phosphatase family metal-dependent hydrolase